MLYINNSEKTRLASVNREGVRVEPGEVVEMNSTDARMLGGSRIYFVKYTGKKVPVDPKAQEKEAEEEEKNASEAEDKSQEKANKKALKEALNEMNKGELIAFAEKKAKLDVMSRDTKEDIVKEVLKAAKEIGFAKLLKKV